MTHTVTHIGWLNFATKADGSERARRVTLTLGS